VPRQDIIQRSLAPRWRKSYRLASGQANPKLVAQAMTTALAASLRAGGCPDLLKLGSQLRKCAKESSELDWVPAWNDVGKRLAKHRNTRLAQGVGYALLSREADGIARMTVDQATERLASGLVREVARYEFFGRVQPELVRSRFHDLPGETEFETECLEAVPVQKFAEQLVAAPNGKRVRAPARHRQREGTKEMLDQPLE
jgi:hypothetical protein